MAWSTPAGDRGDDTRACNDSGSDGGGEVALLLSRGAALRAKGDLDGAIGAYVHSLELAPTTAAFEAMFELYGSCSNEAALLRYVDCLGSSAAPFRDMHLFCVAARAQCLHSRAVASRCARHMRHPTLARLTLAAFCFGAHLDASEAESEARLAAWVRVLEETKGDPGLRDFFDANSEAIPPKMGFPLAYACAAADLRRITRLIAEWYVSMFPFLAGLPEQLKSDAPGNGAVSTGVAGVVRVGVVSANMKSHSVGKMFHELVVRLDPARFEVHSFVFGALATAARAGDPVADALRRRSSTYTTLGYAGSFRKTVEGWHRTIADARLDVLLYPDLGTDPFTYYLSFARLAPLQVTTWGHPDSVATAMDAFVSSRHFSDRAECYHNEALVKAPGLGMVRSRPTLPPLPRPDRDRVWACLGVPPEATVYLCTQNLQKVVPAFDDAVAGILAADPAAVVVFMEVAPTAHARRAIAKRLAAPAACSRVPRVLFVPAQPFEGFLEVCRAGDVLLDTFPFSSSTSTIECLLLGKCVVTLDGEGVRSSMTTGIYRRLGWTPLVARTVEEYVRIAVGLGADPGRRRMREASLPFMVGELFECGDDLRLWESLLSGQLALLPSCNFLRSVQSARSLTKEGDDHGATDHADPTAHGHHHPQV